jgi:hypothetical protein
VLHCHAGTFCPCNSIATNTSTSTPCSYSSTSYPTTSTNGKPAGISLRSISTYIQFCLIASGIAQRCNTSFDMQLRKVRPSLITPADLSAKAGWCIYRPAAQAVADLLVGLMASPLPPLTQMRQMQPLGTITIPQLSGRKCTSLKYELALQLLPAIVPAYQALPNAVAELLPCRHTQSIYNQCDADSVRAHFRSVPRRWSCGLWWAVKGCTAELGERTISADGEALSTTSRGSRGGAGGKVANETIGRGQVGWWL